jgi:hypothetical protein
MAESDYDKLRILYLINIAEKSLKRCYMFE